MAGSTRSGAREKQSLSRERIVEASIRLLDRSGEDGLTFRALSEELATGPGAIYWHVDNKGDLLRAACDEVIVYALRTVVTGTWRETVRTIGLQLFDVIDDHPWVGSALTDTPGQLSAIRILERIGQQVQLSGTPEEQQWAVVGALMAYILGVSKQNAANRQLAHTQGLQRLQFLESMAKTWSELPAGEYPFTRSMAGSLRDHDDREDFVAGIDLILGGIGASLASVDVTPRRQTARSSS